MQNAQPQTNAARDAGQKETVGRMYERITWGLHSRRKGSAGSWFGRSNYRSYEEASDALQKAGQPFIDAGGGFILGFTGAKELFEYRIVKMVAWCEVINVADVMV